MSKDYLIIDCGSTTTKAILFTEEQIIVADSSTTVEAPNNDVNIGVKNAIDKIKKLSPNLNKFNFLATSSAGGGLQIGVVGFTSDISSFIADKFILNTGAIISITLSADDPDSFAEKVEKLKNSRPDILIFVGGMDSVYSLAIEELISIVKESKLKPRYGLDHKLPIIYSGSLKMKEIIQEELSSNYSLIFTENVLQQVGNKIIGSKIAEKEIQDAVNQLFLNDVMHHAPGYSVLKSKVNSEILPTPLSVSLTISNLARIKEKSILAVDIGGATTDIFTALKEDSFKVQRSVSANYGMSYSASSVLKDSGLHFIKTFIESAVTDEEIQAYIWNKTINPTSLPITEIELNIEKALCIAALRLSYNSHKKIALTESKFNNFEIIIASGGALSHARDINSIPWILSSGFQIAGIQEILLDTNFMMPHLGVLSQVDSRLATNLLTSKRFDKIGYLLTVKSKDGLKSKSNIADLYISNFSKTQIFKDSKQTIEINKPGNYEIKIIPKSSLIDCGAGFGKEYIQKFNVESNSKVYISA